MAIGEYQIQDSGLQIQVVIDKVQAADQAPVAGSRNLVESGGVKAALDQKATKSDVNEIEGKIPSSASSSNKMATQADLTDFITRAVTDLVNYYTKSQTYTKLEVNNLIGALHQFHFEIYATLPATGDGSVLYLIGPTGTGSDKYEEYVWANDAWTKIGDTTIDLSGYVTTEALNTALANYTTTSQLTELLNAKADKDTDAVSGNLAEFDANGNPVDSGDKKEDYVKKGSWDSSLTAGLAENLIDTKGQGSEQSFTRRTSCGEESISDDGSALFKKLLGKSLVWNQLSYENSTLWTQYDFSTRLNYNTTLHEITIKPLNLSSNKDCDANLRIEGNNHKFVFKATIIADPEKIRLVRFYYNNTSDVINIANGSGYVSAFLTQNVAGNRLVKFRATMKDDASSSDVVTIKDAVCFDLTLMFGAGNEPSTVAEFEALFNKSYYAYNAGQIINNNVEAYETVGFNQWDEEWEVGQISPATGKNITNTNNIRTKNYIRVIPNTYYYASTKRGAFNICTYDSNKNFLSVVRESQTGRFNSGDGASFIRFCTVAGYGPTYNHDICINLSWSGYRNGEYEPYWKRSMKIDWKKLYGKLNGQGEMVQIAPNGGRSAGTVYDVADFVRKEADITLVSVDLGSLEWTLYQGQFLNQTAVPARGGASGQSLGYNVICSRYSPTSATSYSEILNGEVGIGSGGVDSLRIVDSNYSSASTFKAAMNGVELVYPLATPLHYTDLMMSDDGGQTFYDIPTSSKVADFGVEIAVPCEEVDANGVPKSAPLRAVIKYSDDVTRGWANRNKNLQSQESMDALLSALGTAMGGTWSKTWDSTNGKWTYSFTANSQSE